MMKVSYAIVNVLLLWTKSRLVFVASPSEPQLRATCIGRYLFFGIIDGELLELE